MHDLANHPSRSRRKRSIGQLAAAGFSDSRPAGSTGKPLVYLDSGASSQKPRAGHRRRSAHYYEHDHSNVHRGIHELSNRATGAYEGCAGDEPRGFLNADGVQSEIVFTQGARRNPSTSWRPRGAIATSSAGDKILLTELEHHANLIPWQLVAKRKGAELIYVPVLGRQRNARPLAKLDELLTPEP